MRPSSVTGLIAPAGKLRLVGQHDHGHAAAAVGGRQNDRALDAANALVTSSNSMTSGAMANAPCDRKAPQAGFKPRRFKNEWI